MTSEIATTSLQSFLTFRAIGAARATRPRAVFVGLATLFGVGVAHAQGSEFRGIVRNHGRLMQPSTAGLEGSLIWRLHADSRAESIEIGAPLGGSGAAQSIRWADSVLIISVSVSGDTIAWLGRIEGDTAAGEYAILGGQFAEQGGRWNVQGPGLSGMELGAAPDSAALHSLVVSTAGLRRSATRTPSIAPSAPTPRQSGSDELWLVYFIVAVGLIAGAALVARHFVARSEVAAGPRTPGPGEFVVTCPTCKKRPIQDAREVWFMYGFLVVTRYGSRTFIGCRYCTRQDALKALALNTVAGWWCIPWGLGTPFVVLQNIIAVLERPPLATLEAKLKAAGVDADDIRLDRDGLTRETRELIEAASFVLATAVLADGRQHPAELRRASTILAQLTGNRLSDQALKGFISRGRTFKRPLSGLPFELRQTLLSVALDVALADGELAVAEVAMLHDLANRLGFASGVVEQMLGEMLGTSRNQSRERDRSRSRRTRSGGDLDRARAILGVRAGATLMEVKQAWRELMLRHHPDRAGPSKAHQAAATTRSQELNWAYALIQDHVASSGTPEGEQHRHAT